MANTDAVQRAIAELQEIKSRSAETDRKLSATFFRAVLLYLRYEKESLLQAVLTTCERLRVKHVQEVISWSTGYELTFQRIETLVIPVVDDKKSALYTFVGHKQSHKSLFSLIDEYLAYRKTNREHARKKALEALQKADLIHALQSVEKAIKTVERKFPQHSALFAYLQEALDTYSNRK